MKSKTNTMYNIYNFIHCIVSCSHYVVCTTSSYIHGMRYSSPWSWSCTCSSIKFNDMISSSSLSVSKLFRTSTFSHAVPLQFLHAVTHGSPCFRQEHNMVPHGFLLWEWHLHRTIFSSFFGAGSTLRWLACTDRQISAIPILVGWILLLISFSTKGLVNELSLRGISLSSLWEVST